MGLDLYWKPGLAQDGTSKEITVPGLKLISGMLSGGGDGSFRGKCYDSVVAGVTGESLYQEAIPNATVMRMFEALQKTPFEEACAHDPDLDEQQYTDLQRMFKAFAEAGYTLHGWW